MIGLGQLGSLDAEQGFNSGQGWLRGNDRPSPDPAFPAALDKALRSAWPKPTHVFSSPIASAMARSLLLCEDCELASPYSMDRASHPYQVTEEPELWERLSD